MLTERILRASCITKATLIARVDAANVKSARPVRKAQDGLSKFPETAVFQVDRLPRLLIEQYRGDQGLEITTTTIANDGARGQGEPTLVKGLPDALDVAGAG